MRVQGLGNRRASIQPVARNMGGQNIRNPYLKNPSPNPKNPSPKNPNTNSGSNPQYPKLLQVIRVSDHGTRTTRNNPAQISEFPECPAIARMTTSRTTGAADQDRAPVARMACTSQGRSANVNAHAFATDLHMHRSVRQTVDPVCF